MIHEITNVQLADGTKLEIKLKDRWFEKPEIKRSFKNVIVATRINKTKPILRFFFVHPSYFRGFEDLGLPLLFMPCIENYNKYQAEIAEIIQSSKETANVEFAEFTNKIAPILMEVFIKPFFQWLEEVQKAPPKTEKEIKEKVIVSAIEKMEESTRDKDIIKAFVKKHVSSEIFSALLSLLETIFNLFCSALTEKGLERYKLLAQEISDNDIELYNKTTSALLECDVIRPLVTVSICMNKYCKHTEVTFSNRRLEAKCGRCNGDTLSATFTFINEPYLWLKDKMLDLHALLYSYLEAKRGQEYMAGELKPSVECFLNAYIRNVSTNNEREIDALLYSPSNKKAIATEIKIHQIRSQLPSERLQSILSNDLKQLIEIMQEIGLRLGCYITNLKISGEEIKQIKENPIPKLTGDYMIKDLEIISAINESTFLNRLSALVDCLKKG